MNTTVEENDAHKNALSINGPIKKRTLELSFTQR